MTPPLDEAETARWAAWKRANDAVNAAVATAIADASGLSVADFSVLSRVVEHGGGRMAQQELGDMLGWQRARLSRHLGRMAERGLVDRDTDADRRRRVVVTEPGLRSLRAARPAHADAVRRALLAPTSSPGGDEFWATVVRLADCKDSRGGGAERGDGNRGP